jgi:hypothetical protein
MSEARDIFGRYLQRTGLRQPSDAAQQYTVSLLRQWTEHLAEVLEANEIEPYRRAQIIREFLYGAVPLEAEAELRMTMRADWAQRLARGTDRDHFIGDLG